MKKMLARCGVIFLAAVLLAACGGKSGSVAADGSAEIPEDIYAMDEATRTAHNISSLPATLDDALDAMERDPLIMEVLGEHVARHYIEGKRKEWAEYQARVSGWELEKYLVTY